VDRLNDCELVVPLSSAGQRLDAFLVAVRGVSTVPVMDLSRARMQQLIKDGDVTVDGAVAKPSLRLHGGEVLKVSVPPPKELGLVPEAMSLEILYEDEHLIAVNKPAGLLVHPGAGAHTGTLVHALLAHCRDLSGIGGVERPGIVHRLDRGTSGVMVVAKNDRAHESLARQFATRTARKRYVAFVFGAVQPKSGRIVTFHGRHPTQRRRFTTRVNSGRQAVTEYECVVANGGISELEIDLMTGRTHQIRVHFSERGNPVVGDPLYGGRNFARIKDERLRMIAERFDHQALHAAVLKLCHPDDGRQLVLVAPLPQELRVLRQAMQLSAL
jgi:23S rRNA pseudouridine1911/1915/1917 synthase